MSYKQENFHTGELCRCLGWLQLLPHSIELLNQEYLEILHLGAVPHEGQKEGRLGFGQEGVSDLTAPALRSKPLRPHFKCDLTKVPQVLNILADKLND